MRQSTPVPLLSRYIFAFALTAIALVLRWLLMPVLGPSTPFVLLAITISAWYGGLGPGLLSTFLICTVAAIFPALAISAASKTYSVLPFIITILIIGVIISALIESLRREQVKAQTTANYLAEINERFEMLVNSVKDYGIFMLDIEGRIISWNEGARTINGYETEEIIGRHFSTFHPAGDIASGKPEMELRVATVTGRFEEEGWRLRKDGSRFWANVVIAAVHDATGELRGFSKVTRDMTDHRQALERDRLLIREQAAREEAENANKAKDQFLAVLSHELRTPSNTIVGWAYLLKNGLLDEQAARNACESIERSSKVQMRLIEDLLDVSRMLAGKLSVEKIPLDLSAVVETAVDAVQFSVQEKHIDLQVHRWPTSLCVEGDAVRLEQVICNLLHNAIKFTPAKGKIVLQMAKDGDKAEIKISDNGSGILPPMLPHIFEHFQQADSSATRRHGGLGLGLAIVHHIVQAHDGTVVAQSEGEDRGATFIVQLPLLSTPASSIDRSEA